ncbi:hypothetical protein B0H12DRAFT_476904 [Mycena haematopus]|nr:hypothetical protein B0H12DRAFT_476904 [Mycena haematopus]
MRRTTELDAMSDASSSSYVSRAAKASPLHPGRLPAASSSTTARTIPFASFSAASQPRLPNLLASTSLRPPPPRMQTLWPRPHSPFPPLQTARPRLPPQDQPHRGRLQHQRLYCLVFASSPTSRLRSSSRRSDEARKSGSARSKEKVSLHATISMR